MISLPVLPSLHGIRVATLVKLLWSHRAKTKWRSRHVDESVGLATERLLRISPGSTIPYKHSLKNTPTSSLTSLHSHTHWEFRSHKTFPCQIGHPFYWWFVTWNLKAHFHLVIWPIPQPAYVRLLIFFYYTIPLITPSTINDFVILRPLVLFLVFLLSCFRHPPHSSTNVPQVPSAHITFRCHAPTLVLTENGQRQILWEIALVDTFSHTLSTLCQSSTKGLG